MLCLMMIVPELRPVPRVVDPHARHPQLHQDLPHHIAILSIMPSRGFHAKVIKTKVMPVAVILNDLETNVVEPEHNISAGNDGIGFLVGLQEFQ